jgi:hypothetical protein
VHDLVADGNHLGILLVRIGGYGFDLVKKANFLHIYYDTLFTVVFQQDAYDLQRAKQHFFVLWLVAFNQNIDELFGILQDDGVFKFFLIVGDISFDVHLNYLQALLLDYPILVCKER